MNEEQYNFFPPFFQIYYTGKYQSLGIKQGGPSAGKWVELPITKSPKIVQFSVGHDGSHALLVAEDGSIFFTGSASKGEDGESSRFYYAVINWLVCEQKKLF